MNTFPRRLNKIAVFGTVVLVLSACASAPSAPQGAAAVRNKLTLLQGDAQLASLAPVEIREAEVALRLAESPERDAALGTHRVLLADRKVDIARDWAQTRLYEAQRADLDRASEQARLDARTREANAARNETARARGAAEVAREQAATARDQAAIARDQATTAREQTAVAEAAAATARSANAATQQENVDLERELAALNARDTDRGLVITLGDVLFATGQSTIMGGSTDNLDQLAAFLNRYEERDVTIEGHTDDVGDSNMNLALSQRRADAVRSYLVAQGIATARLSASGLGEATPVASNASSAGRQQNRRVEVIVAEAR